MWKFTFKIVIDNEDDSEMHSVETHNLGLAVLLLVNDLIDARKLDEPFKRIEFVDMVSK